MKISRQFLKIICFILLTAVVLLGIQRVFRVNDHRIFQIENSFYHEEKNSLDAVYIGASNVYPFFQAPLAWEDYGIAVHPFAISNLMPQAIPYIVKEVQKTQPDTLYIINLNTYKKTTVTEEKIEQTLHYAADYMPFSLNKLQMVNEMCAETGITGLDKMEFFFPLIRFHSGWSELTEEDFVRVPNGLKGASTYSAFVSMTEDVTARAKSTDARTALEKKQQQLLEELMAYCDENGLNVLFVIVPQAIDDEEELAQLNQMGDLVQEHGYPCLDLMHQTDEMGLRYDRDFYNDRHLNLHGSIKFTDYLAGYLSAAYNLSDKRGTGDYQSWDASVSLYHEKIDTYCMPFELAHAPQAYDLPEPEIALQTEVGSEAVLTWGVVDGADGYEIYRKSQLSDERAWHLLDETTALTVTDRDIVTDVIYKYSVVPYRNFDGIRYYGDFSYKGIKFTGGKN